MRADSFGFMVYCVVNISSLTHRVLLFSVLLSPWAALALRSSSFSKVHHSQTTSIRRSFNPETNKIEEFEVARMSWDEVGGTFFERQREQQQKSKAKKAEVRRKHKDEELSRSTPGGFGSPSRGSMASPANSARSGFGGSKRFYDPLSDRPNRDD